MFLRTLLLGALLSTAFLVNSSAATVPDNFSDEEIGCLAQTIYFEAGNQPYEGQIAVAFVVLHRVEKSSRPISICNVVHQTTVVKTKTASHTYCQFAWYCSAELQKRPKYEGLWAKAQKLAREFLENHHSIKDPTDGAMFFGRPEDRPPVGKTLIATIGGHRFYK